MLASIPFDTIGGLFFNENDTDELQLFSLLKLVRVLRLSRIITYLNVRDDVKMSLKLLKLVFFLVMYLHCLGCLWYYIVRQNEEWIPPLDYIYLKTDIYDRSINYQYWMSLYHAVLMLTGNDLGPRGSFQIAFVAIFVTIGAIINANIFGELAVLVSAMNRKATIFQEKIDIANTAMKNLFLPEKLQIRVLGFLTYTQTLLESQKELETFLKMISPSIRESVVKHIFHDFLQENSAFKDNEDLIDSLTRKLDVQIYQPEDHLVSQGEEPEKLFFISNGQCRVYVRDQEGNDEEVNVISDGNLFGEIAMLNKCQRTATVKTVNYCTIASITKQEFEDICIQYPYTQGKLKEGMRKYSDKLKVFQKLVLSDIYTKHLEDETLEEMTYTIKQKYYEQDKVIFRAKDKIENLYMILSGTVEIFIELKDKEILFDTLSRGCLISLYGILDDRCNTFTCRAKTGVHLYYITKESMKSLINTQPDLGKKSLTLLNITNIQIYRFGSKIYKTLHKR